MQKNKQGALRPETISSYSLGIYPKSDHPVDEVAQPDQASYLFRIQKNGNGWDVRVADTYGALEYNTMGADGRLPLPADQFDLFRNQANGVIQQALRGDKIVTTEH